MRNAETVLNVIRDRGRRGLTLEDVYRQLFNPDLFLRAYGRIYRNTGAMTQGITAETVDGMSLAKIHALIEQLRYERYRWTPVRRTYIPKKSGKRPLGIPTWSDKLLQEVIRSLLEAYFEPQFSDHSYGFRPQRGCHTALTQIARKWKGTKWFIEGDIKQCFDNIDHDLLLSILRENIHDNRFLRLIENLLKAGYLEEWKYHATLSGSPQGGIVSPILSNIYLDRLDRYVEHTLIPAYTQGVARKRNPTYMALNIQAYYLRRARRWDEAHELDKIKQKLPSCDPTDPDYRRLHYARYADDWLLGFVGPKAEAQEIKEQLGGFLQDTLKLELSPEKTLITHAASTPARFLGYEIVSQHCDTKHDRRGARSVNGVVALRLPRQVIADKCAPYRRKGKPIHRAERIHDNDFTIIHDFQSVYRGIVQYYLLAHNVRWLNQLHWYMQSSLLRTLANKHQSSILKMKRRYSATVDTPHGPRKCLQISVAREGKKPLVATFGGIPLHRQKTAVLQDLSTQPHRPPRTELIKRLLAEECEICGATDHIEVHHIRKLADLKVAGQKEKPLWKQVMAARRRKTLVLCRSCHHNLHSGKPLQKRRSE